MLHLPECDGAVAELGQRLASAPADVIGAATTWRSCADAGLTAMPIDERWGGRSASLIDTARAFDCFAAAGAPAGLVFALGAQLWSVTSVIARFGTDAQRERWLPGLCSGEQRGAHAMTEPMSGSDAFSLATTADVTSDVVVLNGSKIFVTNGTRADLYLVFATTDRTGGWAAVGCYVVERDTAGLEVRSLRTVSAHMAELSTAELDDCAVPADHRLSAASGIVVFGYAMDLERSLLAAGMTGLAAARLRVAAGAGAGAVAAALWSRVVVARLMIERAARRLDAGKRAPRESSMAKLMASELWWDVACFAAGRVGIEATAGERWHDLTDAAAGRVYSGTSEIQRDLLGRGLGL